MTLTNKYLHHLLRGSGSTVLTATSFVNGNHWFSTIPLQILPPLTDRQNCHGWLRRRPLLRYHS